MSLLFQISLEWKCNFNHCLSDFVSSILFLFNLGIVSRRKEQCLRLVVLRLHQNKTEGS